VPQGRVPAKEGEKDQSFLRIGHEKKAEQPHCRPQGQRQLGRVFALHRQQKQSCQHWPDVCSNANPTRQQKNYDSQCRQQTAQGDLFAAAFHADHLILN
jgi:hypothetical protein